MQNKNFNKKFFLEFNLKKDKVILNLNIWRKKSPFKIKIKLEKK